MPDSRFRLLLPPGNIDPIFRTIQRWADTLPFAAYKEWESPILKATTTNPTLGSGTNRGSYKITNDTVEGEVQWVFGAGLAAGTGTYFFDLPIAPLNVGVVGHGLISCAGTAYTGTLYCTLTGTNSQRAFVRSPAAVTDAAPGAWIATDYIRMNFRYRYK